MKEYFRGGTHGKANGPTTWRQTDIHQEQEVKKTLRLLKELGPYEEAKIEALAEAILEPIRHATERLLPKDSHNEIERMKQKLRG